MKRISNNRDLFEAPVNEQITISVEAGKVPFQATFSALESGSPWTQVQTPTLQTPVEIRTFAMPSGSREFFAISYAFPPAASTDPDAKYKTAISGGGTTDGPNSVLPPPSGSTVDLPYEFRLPAAGTASLPATAKKAAVKKGAANKAPAKKKSAATKKPSVKKAASKRTKGRGSR